MIVVRDALGGFSPLPSMMLRATFVLARTWKVWSVRTRRSALSAIVLGAGLAAMLGGLRLVQAQREDPASPPEMLEVDIKVVDELSRPIEGARIVPDGLRARASLASHYGWSEERHGPSVPVLTDSSGIARVAYPKFVEEQRTTGQISFSVTHPGFVGRRPHSFSVDGSEPPIVLVKGARVRVTGLMNGAAVPADRLWVQVSTHEVWYDDTNWTPDGDALVLNQQLPAKPHLVQAAYQPTDGPLLISDARTIDARVGEAYDVQLELKECARLEGTLDRSVPRPIKDGRVVVMVSPAFASDEAGQLFWETWRDVNPDGSFVFESLPPGNAEITALCDGYRSLDGAPREHNLVHPQVRTLNRGTNQYEVAMTPTAACEVTVLKPDGTPLQGAEVWFQPNVKWRIGTTIFAQRRIRMEEFVPGVGQLDTLPPELIAFRSADFRATTDENGTARVINLVDGRHEFVVMHDAYLTPINPRAPERRGASVELTTRETATVNVTMEPAGAKPLDNSNGVEILGSDAAPNR